MSKNSKINLHIWLLALASSVLLSVPYIVPHCGLVSLIALVPLFLAEQLAYNSGKKRFFHVAYTSFLVWNVITTFWIWFATPGGALAAFILNSLQMAIIFSLFRWMRRCTNGFLPYVFFCILWLAWEHSYQTWQITWPWLVLGNSFASSVGNIQWYEYTGVLGGSLWILLTNMLIHRIILLKARKKAIRVSVISVLALIFIPIIISRIIYSSYEEKLAPAQFAVLQPNIDPYGEKFYGQPLSVQTQGLLSLADMAMAHDTSASCMVVAPETFIFTESYSTALLESAPLANDPLCSMAEWTLAQNRNTREVSFITGAVTFSSKEETRTVIGNNRQLVTVTRRVPDTCYNASVFIAPQPGDTLEQLVPQFYHKSKLVVLAESNPFKNGPFKFMDKLVSGMAGGIGDYGTQPYRTVYEAQNGVKTGTAICYESVFSDFYREWPLNGANVMTIITNDGWWRDTPGHIQHLNYARLRAIENRRSIARCANTGISAFINQRGDIVEQTGWWERGYLTGSLNLNEEMTIFTQYGDITGRLSRFLAFIFLLMGVARRIAKKYIGIR